MISKFLKNAWEAYKGNFWTIIGSLFIFFVIVFGVILLAASPFIFSVLFFGNIPTSSPQTIMSKFVTSDLSFFTSILVFVGIMIGGFIAVILSTGLVGIYYEALKEDAKVKTMFKVVKSKFWTILGAKVLYGLIVIGIFLGLIFPGMFLLFLQAKILGIISLIIGLIAGIFIIILFMLIDQAIVIDDKKAIESIKKSYRVVKSNYLSFLAIWGIFIGLSLISGFVPFIGGLIQTFLIGPLMGLTFTSFYMDKK